MNFLEPLAGAITGFIVGLTGVGGGALMTPILLLFFGIAPHTAIGTDLWFAAITKMGIAAVHRGDGTIDWLVLRRLWLGSLPASALTSLWIQAHRFDAGTAAILQKAIAFAVLFTAIGLIVQAPLRRRADRRDLELAEKYADWQAPATVLAGVILGVIVTLTSVGAGALGAVMLVYLYPTRLSPPRLVATDVAHAIPLAIFAGFGHLLAGAVDGRLLAALLLGSVPAGVIAGSISARLPHVAVRGALSLVLVIVGLKLAGTW